MPPGIQLRNGKRIRCTGDGEGTPEDGQATLRVTVINDLPNEVLEMILQPAAVQMCLSSRTKTAGCLGQVYRRLAICRRWKYLLDDPFFHRKIRESVFQIDPHRRYFKSAKQIAISGIDIAQYGNLVAMDFAAGKIFAYKKSLIPYKPNRIVNVFAFQRRHSTQEAWSIHRFGKITIDLKHFESIKQMQFTPFNNQLVILYVNIHNENNIWFQYQTDGENSDPEIWRLPITLPELAIWMHSSPSTGKIYLLYRYPHRIEEYGFSDGLHIRSISLDILKLSYDVPDFRFYHADDQMHIAIGSRKKVVTAPIDAFDEQNLSVRRFRRKPGWLLDCVVDKHSNLFLLTNEGASYGLSFAPANNMERVRLLFEIPKGNWSPYRRTYMVLDEGSGLVFQSLAESNQIHCYRVAKMD